MTYSEQLERETETCRNELADTLDELRTRMTPGEVVDQLVDYAKDTTGGQFFENLKQQIANNPLPVALMGAGFAWLLCGKGISASRLRQSTASVADKMRQRTAAVADQGHGWLSDSAEAVMAGRGEAFDRVTAAGTRASDTASATATVARERIRAGTKAMSDAAADAASRAKETMGDATAQVKDAASRVRDTTEHLKDATTAAGAAFGDTVSDTYDRAAASASRSANTVASSASRITSSAVGTGRDFMDFCREQPLVLAGIGLAVGAAMGAWLPRTQTEDQLMGDVSDELKEQTKEFAGEQLQKAKKVGEHAYDAAQEEAERQGPSGEALANEAASRLQDTSIAPSSEADACSGETGENKPEPVHERH
jgi:uncharacterized phage infection (PIP) family protein YhgE